MMYYINCRRSRASKNGEYQRNWKLKNKYGITEDQFQEALKKQDGKCLICKVVMNIDDPKQPGDRATVDHCHRTRRFRGIICSACNRGLGQFKDNAELLIQAAEYIKTHDRNEFPATA